MKKLKISLIILSTLFVSVSFSERNMAGERGCNTNRSVCSDSAGDMKMRKRGSNNIAKTEGRQMRYGANRGSGRRFGQTLSTTPGGGLEGVPSSKLSALEKEGLLFMREEEELARDLYLNIYEAKGNRLTVFKNISSRAETKHAEAIRALLKKYDIDDPSTGNSNTYTDPELQNLYDDLINRAVGSDDVAALRVGAYVEETDIRDINTHKSHVSAEHQDIIATYDRLLCGSRNHLRAFAKQIENRTGSSYITQVPELDAEVSAILSSDKERCGK